MIRYAKDERDAMTAAGDKLGAAQARKKSAALGREYRAFCETTGLTPRPERTRSMTGPTVIKAGSGLAKQGGYGILKSRENQGILITEEAIRRVPQVIPSGWSFDRAALLQEAHKDLLRFVKDQPVGIEATAVYTPELVLHKRKLGTMYSVRIPPCSGKHIAIHNHPDGLVFSLADIEGFGKRFEMEMLTAVGNNGAVYVLQKTENYDPVRFSIALGKEIPYLGETSTMQAFSDEMERFLREAKKYGVQFITGTESVF